MYNYYDLKQLNPNEIIMYLRKSRADDPLLSVSEVLSKHEAILDEWVEKNLSGPIPKENRYKEVVSGESIADRPKFQQVLRLVEAPTIKAILVVELSRLGRPDMEEIGRLSKTFRYTNTIIITPMKLFDITDEYERDMFEQELKRGNFYLEYTKKLLSRGRELSVKSGNYVCSRPPYGYDKIIVMEDKRKCPTLAVNEEQANIVRMIFNSYVNENTGTSSIAKRLNSLNIKSPRNTLWSADAIRTILENDHYIGVVKFNERKAVHIVSNGEFKKTRPKADKGEFIYCKGKHDAIISDELFYAAQEKRGRSHRTCDNKTLRNPLASLLYCECGRAMSYRHSTRGNLQYREPRLVCNGQHQCGNGSCSVNEVVDFVARIMRKKISEFKLEAKKADDGSSKMQEAIVRSLERKLSDIDAKELSLWEAQVEDKKMPEHIFQALTAKLTKDREDTTVALEKARTEISIPIDYAKKVVTLQAALDALLDDNVSVLEKNRLLKTCIERITYHRPPYQRPLGKGSKKNHTPAPISLNITLKV